MFESEWRRCESEAREEETPLQVFAELSLDRYDDSIVEPLIRRLDDDDVRIVLGAALGLERLPRFSELVIPRIIPHLGDPHPWIAEAMAWIVHEHGDAALPILRDQYVTSPQHARNIARAIATRGPGAIGMRELLLDDADAVREITGPWPTEPEMLVPYLGESVRMDDDGPAPRAAYGRPHWIDAIESQALYADDGWNRTNPEAEAVNWWPAQIAIAASEIELGMFDPETGSVIHTVLRSSGRFTKLDVLYAALVAHHELAPVNDRIFEGIAREQDGSYYVATGS